MTAAGALIIVLGGVVIWLVGRVVAGVLLAIIGVGAIALDWGIG